LVIGTTAAVLRAADRTTTTTAVFENRKHGKRRGPCTLRGPQLYRVTYITTMRFSFTSGGGGDMVSYTYCTV